MTDEATIAARLFPSAVPTTVAPPAAKPSAEKSVAERIYKGPEPYKSPFADPGKAAGEQEPEKAPKAAKAEPDAEKPGDAEKPTPEEITAKAEELIEAVGLDSADPRTSQFGKVAAELGLDKDGATKLAELDLKTRNEFWDTNAADWRAATETEFSADEIDLARGAVAKYGDEELLSLFETYRFGSHPAVVRFALAAARGGRRT